MSKLIINIFKLQLQRVEKELQEKAAAQLLPSKRESGDGGENTTERDRCSAAEMKYFLIKYYCRHKREAGDGVENETSPTQSNKNDEKQVN